MLDLLPSGLYRRLWNYTRSVAFRLVSESRAMDTLDTSCVITAGQEFHLALKIAAI